MRNVEIRHIAFCGFIAILAGACPGAAPTPGELSRAIPAADRMIRIHCNPELPVPNLIRNGDFEDRTPGDGIWDWRFSGAVPQRFETGVEQDGSGNHFAWITANCDVTSGYLRQDVAVRPDTKYYARVDCYALSGKGLVWISNRPLDERIWIDPSTRNYAFFDGFVNPEYACGGTGWRTYSKEFTTTVPRSVSLRLAENSDSSRPSGGIRSLMFQIGCYFEPGTILYDNVFLGLAETDMAIEVNDLRIKRIVVWADKAEVFRKEVYPSGSGKFSLGKVPTYKQYIVEVTTEDGKQYYRRYPERPGTAGSAQASLPDARIPLDRFGFLGNRGEDFGNAFNPAVPTPAAVRPPAIRNNMDSSVTITGGGVSAELDTKRGFFRGFGDDRLPAIRLSEFKKGDVGFVLKKVDQDTKENVLSAVLEAPADQLTATHRVQGSPDWLSWEIAVKNGSPRPRLLEVAVTQPVANAPDFKVWNGNGFVPDVTRPDRNVNGTMPVAFWISNREAFGLGLWPLQWASRYEADFLPAANGRPNRMDYSVRIVVDPGQTEKVAFVMFRFVPRWGMRSGLQCYMETCPAAFYPAPGISPDVLRAGGHTFSSVATRQLAWEETRRIGYGVDWCFAPFQTPGDWYPDERYWSKTKGCGGDVDRPVNVHTDMSLDDYRKVLRNRFGGSNPGYAAMYFILSYAVDTSLADTVYAKDRWMDANGLVSPYGTWIKPDAYVRFVYPWGNEYGREVQRELKQIVEDFQPTGFAFDESYGVLPHYGSGVAGSPGRGWDDQGRVFVLQGVALGELAQYVHSLQTWGHRTGLVANNVLNYLIGFRADAGLFEPAIWAGTERFLKLRYLLGHKPITSWVPWSGILAGIDWKKVPTGEMSNVVTGLSDYLWLVGLKYGLNQYDLANRGVARLAHGAKFMNELNRLGWQPEPAITGDERLWVSRYGADSASVCVISNPTGTRVDSKMKAISDCLGGGVRLPVDYTGRKLRFSATGRETTFEASLDPKVAAAVRLPLVLKECSGDVAGESEMTLDPMKSGCLVWKFSCSKPGRFPVEIRIPDEYRVDRIVGNGRPQTFTVSAAQAGLQMACDSANELTVHLVPESLLIGAKSDITDFEYVTRDKKPACKILYPAHAGERNARLAQWIGVYFEYWYWRQTNPVGFVSDAQVALQKSALGIPLVPQSAAEGVQWIAVVPRAADAAATAAKVKEATRRLPKDPAASITLAGNDMIVIAAGSEDALQHAVMRVFDVLDGKYKWCGGLGAFSLPASTLKQEGIFGKVVNNKPPVTSVQGDRL